MITLHKLVPPENETLFKCYGELDQIWEIPALQRQARESYEGWHIRKYEGEKAGEIFTIDEDGAPIGVIGWFEYGNVSDVLRLSYYGIVPSRRGNRYGEQAMKLFLGRLSWKAPEQYVFLSESVTLSREAAPRIIAHFEKMGFEKFDDPGYGSNAGCGKTQSLRIRIPGR